MTGSLSTCNSCGWPVEEPNLAGYCDNCQVAATISTLTGLTIWSACTTPEAARRYRALWAQGGRPYEVAFRADLSPDRPWVVYAAADADAVSAWRADG